MAGAGRLVSGAVTGKLLSAVSLAIQARPAILHGLRIAASVTIALYLSFFLQLDQPSWAGTTAAIVAQPVLGAALRKGWFRLIGTIAGAVAAVVLVALFPQSRTGFFFGLALWCGLCGTVATILRNFAAYAGIIAGFTAAVVSLNAIPEPDQVLIIALSRASAITIGIIITTLVFSLTDFGEARENLADRMLRLSREILAAVGQALRDQAGSIEASTAHRRALFAEITGLDAIIDQAIGESFAVRARAATLHAALSGLLSALSAWRTIEFHLSKRPGLAERAGLGTALPGRAALSEETAADPAVLREALRQEGLSLSERPAADASSRLLLDQTGKALFGLAQTMNGIALLRTPGQAKAVAVWPAGRTFDPLVAILNGVRIALAVGAAALFWIFSQWPDGPMFITFVVIVLLFYTKQDEQAFDAGFSMVLGCLFAAIAAGILKFVFLPHYSGYEAFALLLAALLIPGGALATLPGIGAVAFLYQANIVPMMSPENLMVYDLRSFLNNALAIVTASLAGAAGYRLLPPLSPAVRARRQLAAALRDLRRLARGRWRPSAATWEERLYDRMIALPSSATPLQRGQIITVLGAGLAIRQLWNFIAAKEGEGSEQVLSMLAAGQMEEARAAAGALVDRLAPQAQDDRSMILQRFCAALREIEEALAAHPAFFAGRG